MARAKKNPKAKRNPKPAKAEFPYRKQDDAALADAAQVARARYHREARAEALEIFKEAQGIGDEDERREFFEAQIDQHADDAVQVTPDALAIVMQSDRWTQMGDAIDEGIASFKGITDVSEAITKIAFWAYRQDLLEYIEAFENEGVEENPGPSGDRGFALPRSQTRQYEKYSVEQLRAMPSIASGHTDELKVEEIMNDTPTKWWLSRMTVADGETHAVHVEQLVNGVWQVVHDYGRPRRR